MNVKKLISITLLVIVIVGGFILFKKTNFSQSDSNVLIVGTVAGYAPFVSVNEQGQYEGFDIDVANALAKQMDRTLVLKDLGSMTSLFMALEQGSIDAAIWGLSITSDRLEKIAMVRYQGEVTKSYPLLFWNKIPEGVTSISDMRGMTVCVEPNSSQDEVLRKYDSLTIKPTEKVDDALLNIQYGKVDAAFVEPAIANKFKNKYPQIQILDVELAPEDQVQGIGIAIRKNNVDLIKSVEKAIEQLRNDQTIQKFEKKWDIV